MRHRSLVIVCSVFAVSAIACGVDTSTGSSDDEVLVRPGGSDKPGALLVTVSSSGDPVAPTTVSCLSQNKPLGELLEGLTVGSQTFTLKATGSGFPLQVRAKASIASSQTTTIAAGLVGVDAISGARTVGLRDLRTSHGAPVSALDPNVVVSASIDPGSDGVTRTPMLEGEYDFAFGLDATDGVRAKVTAGGTTIVKLSDPSDRRVTRLKAPARERPNASCGTVDPNWYIELASGATTYASVSLKDGEEVDLGVSRRAEGKSYRLRAGIWSRPVAVPLVPRGVGPGVWPIGRIDVDHVSINGGPPTVKGTYAIYPADSTGKAIGDNILRCTPETNTGVDVPPGHYRIEISYPTAESGTKVDVHVVDT
jgi:hypothetical protein